MVLPICFLQSHSFIFCALFPSPSAHFSPPQCTLFPSPVHTFPLPVSSAHVQLLRTLLIRLPVYNPGPTSSSPTALSDTLRLYLRARERPDEQRHRDSPADRVADRVADQSPALQSLCPQGAACQRSSFGRPLLKTYLTTSPHHF